MYKLIILTVVFGTIAYLLYAFSVGTAVPVPTGPALTFNGNGFTSFGAGSEYDVGRTRFTMEIKTTSPTGTLIYGKAEDDDFFSATIVNGHVTISVDMGSGVFTNSLDDVNVSDGLWHTVSFERQNKRISLQVDHSTIRAESPTKNINISRPTVIYIGGTNVAESPKFTGCMRNISFNDRYNIRYDFTPGGVAMGCFGQ